MQDGSAKNSRPQKHGIKLTEENKKGNTACKTYGVVFSEEYKASNIKASGTPGHLFHLRPHRSYMRLSREEGVESKLADRLTARFETGMRLDHWKARKSKDSRGPLTFWSS